MVGKVDDQTAPAVTNTKRVPSEFVMYVHVLKLAYVSQHPPAPVQEQGFFPHFAAGAYI